MLLRFGFVVLTAGLLFADTVTLREGRAVEGTFVGGDSRSIRVLVGDRVETFSLQSVSSIRFGPSAAPAAQPAPAVPLRSDRLRPAPQPAAAAQPAVPASRSLELASGTQFTVRMIEDVDSQRDNVGQTFRASLDEPVMVDGQVVIPRGADVLTKLVDDKESGKLSGRTELTMDIVSVQVDGRMVEIDTEAVTRASGSRTARSAKVVGGTTALGAIIGAIAGGGKGAAVGAASGAGVGTAAQVLTKGQRVRIPSETRLTFSLQQPVRL